MGQSRHGIAKLIVLMAEQDFLGSSCFSLRFTKVLVALMPQHVVSEALCLGWKTQKLGPGVQTGQPTPHPHCMCGVLHLEDLWKKLLKLWNALTSPALGEPSFTNLHGHSQHGEWPLAGPRVASKCMILVLTFVHLHAGNRLLQ